MPVGGRASDAPMRANEKMFTTPVADVHVTVHNGTDAVDASLETDQARVYQGPQEDDTPRLADTHVTIGALADANAGVSSNRSSASTNTPRSMRNLATSCTDSPGTTTGSCWRPAVATTSRVGLLANTAGTASNGSAVWLRLVAGVGNVP